MIGEEYGSIENLGLAGLREHFKARTGPGGDMEIPPNGVAWTIMSPFPGIRDALARAVKSKGHHIGVLMPQSDTVIRPGVRTPYEEGTEDVSAGSLRRLNFTITLFVRSMKLHVLDGAFTILPSWLEELTRSYPRNDTVRIGSVKYMGLEPDYLIIEAEAFMDYPSLTHKLSWRELTKIVVEGSDTNDDGSNDFWFDLEL